MCNYKFAFVQVAWNEEELGSEWMNTDNMKALLYTDAKTSEDLLTVVGYSTYDFEKDAWFGWQDYDLIDQYCECWRRRIRCRE